MRKKYTFPLWKRGLNGSPAIISTLWGSLFFCIYVRAAAIICARSNNVPRACATALKISDINAPPSPPTSITQCAWTLQIRALKKLWCPCFWGDYNLTARAWSLVNAIRNMTVLSINSYRALLWIGQPALCGKLADCQGVFSRVWRDFQSAKACVMCSFFQ